MSVRSGLGRWLWLAIAVAGAGGAWYHWAGRASPVVQAKNPAVVEVTAVKPTQADFERVFEASGTVAALSRVELRAQTTSTVKAVHVNEGDFVRAGQLLFTLDDRADRAQVAQAQAQQARDQAAWADAQRQVKRSRELIAQGFLAQSALDTLLTQADALKAAVSGAQAALRVAQVNLSYNVVHAPIAGRIGAIGAYPGTLVLANASANPMLTITRMNPVSVGFTLPEGLLQSVRTRWAQGPVTVEALAAGAPAAVRGTLSFIDSSIDTGVGGASTKAQFDNANLLLWPGQSAKVRVTVEVLPAVWQLPLAALITSPTGLMVYTVDNDGLAQPRNIKLLGQAGTVAAVEGLKGDEVVVLDGKHNLRKGSRVRVSQAPGVSKPL